MELIRINKFLAQQGVASRRAVDAMLAEGRISVNGKTVVEMGMKIDPSKDKILVDGNSVQGSDRMVYIVLNKPEGTVVSSKKTEQAKDIVLDLVKVPERVFPVGRLDKETSGLLILTNDGDLALKLTHPSFECEKEYEVTVHGTITPAIIHKLEQGVKLWGVRTNPATVTPLGHNRMRIVITEGKNRQIRRICQKLGISVKTLKRLRVKQLTLGTLSAKQWRYLKPEEVEALKQ